MGHVPFSTIETFSQICLEAGAPTEVSDALTTLLRNHGVFSWFVGSLPYVTTNGAKGFGFHSMPEKWLRRYLDAHHFDHDPVFQYALTSRRKSTWKSCRRQSELAGLGARSLSIFDEAAQFELTDGLIMPMRGIGDLPGAVTYGGYDPDLSPQAQLSLYLVGAYAYEGFRRLAEGFRPIPPFLTDQELQVLRWTAEGKSATVIGKIMGLSPHTVREHQQHVKDKYDVATLIQAAIFALMDGNLRLAAGR